MFEKPLAEIFQVCFSIISLSIFVDILTSKLDLYLSQKITKFQSEAVEVAIYRPLVQRFNKYISLIDAVLNILIANLVDFLSPQGLKPVFWISVIILIVNILILLPKYRELVAKIRSVKARSKELNEK